MQKEQRYSLRFKAKGDGRQKVGLSVHVNRPPYRNLGLNQTVQLSAEAKVHEFVFTATEDEQDGRLSLLVGVAGGVTEFGEIELRSAGLQGLEAGEDPTQGTVAMPSVNRGMTGSRAFDWHAFLQEIEQRYYVEMRDFLREEVGVRVPITGTIALGPLGTLTQAKMDFVDAHVYWDHPEFPGRAWDAKEWRIRNQSMVQHPGNSALHRAATLRVAGKPFTVSEYNHAAPNEFAAECIPMAASFAAMQDWDGVFIFAYTHSDQFAHQKISSFFDIEGDPAKMALLPLGARIFLGELMRTEQPRLRVTVPYERAVRGADRAYDKMHDFMRSEYGLDWRSVVGQPMETEFVYTAGEGGIKAAAAGWKGFQWSVPTAGQGAFVMHGQASVFVGSPLGVSLPQGYLQRLDNEFGVVMVVPMKVTTGQPRQWAVAALGKVGNTEMGWDAQRRTVGTQWGKPPAWIEPLRATLRFPAEPTVRLYAVNAGGVRGDEVPMTGDPGASSAAWQMFDLSSVPSLYYLAVESAR